jgi:hypothetical protein
MSALTGVAAPVLRVALDFARDRLEHLDTNEHDRAIIHRQIVGIEGELARRDMRLTEYTDAAFPHYVECALWSSNDRSDPETGGYPMDANYGPEDIAPESLASMRADVRDFIREAGELLDDITPEMAGHDFWLTRNRHGAGFWDRGYGDVGDRLTDIAHGYGESYLYVGDDSLVYVG